MTFNMRKIFFSELFFWILFAVVGLYFIYPLNKKIRLGMDLVGGTYLNLEVQTEEAVKQELVELMKQINERLKNEGKGLESQQVQDQKIELVFKTIQETQQAASIITNSLPAINRDLVNKVTITSENTKLIISFTEPYVRYIKQQAVERDIEVLRVRLRSNIEEIPIASQGERNIIIELPGTQNPQEAKQRIGTSAKLEFKLVDRVGISKEEILFDYDGEIPANKEILPGKEKNEFYLVDRYADVTGSMLLQANRGEGEHFEPIVNIKFNSVGAQKFAELTSKNYGRKLAIVLDNVVIQAPTINAAIKDGQGHITGFTRDTAKELALLLTSGSFVAPVKFGQERQIGPSLGQEARNQGLTSCLIGLGLLLLFSIYFYKLSGLFAFLALVYNLILVLFGLSWLHATLTLPGIAGMVLTIGMAIDASILIYERIKEELAKGMVIDKAVQLGFSGAMRVILDANITTFIVGVVLYYFGTGPIQGFAVTMMLGILATLITGLFFLRSLFSFLLKNFHIKKLSI